MGALDPEYDAAGNASLRILVVDDVETNRAILRRLIARRGFDVIEAGNGLTAIEMVRAKAPDLVLLDYMMASVTGLDVLYKLRRMHNSSALPIIMVTAVGDKELVADCLAAGANDFVTKPVDWPILYARMQAHLGIHLTHKSLLNDQASR